MALTLTGQGTRISSALAPSGLSQPFTHHVQISNVSILYRRPIQTSNTFQTSSVLHTRSRPPLQARRMLEAAGVVRGSVNAKSIIAVHSRVWFTTPCGPVDQDPSLDIPPTNCSTTPMIPCHGYQPQRGHSLRRPTQLARSTCSIATLSTIHTPTRGPNHHAPRCQTQGPEVTQPRHLHLRPFNLAALALPELITPWYTPVRSPIAELGVLTCSRGSCCTPSFARLPPSRWLARLGVLGLPVQPDKLPSGCPPAPTCRSKCLSISLHGPPSWEILCVHQVFSLDVPRR